MVASSSCKKKMLSLFLRFVGFIRTERPMDHAKEGIGRLSHIKENKLYGIDTKFTTLNCND